MSGCSLSPENCLMSMISTSNLSNQQSSDLVLIVWPHVLTTSRGRIRSSTVELSPWTKVITKKISRTSDQTKPQGELVTTGCPSDVT